VNAEQTVEEAPVEVAAVTPTPVEGVTAEAVGMA